MTIAAPPPTTVPAGIPAAAPTSEHRGRGWPWWVAAAAATLVVTVQPLRDPDVWWHLAMGKLILAHGLPSHEPFSFSAATTPWVGQQWLYEVGLARLVGLGGDALAILVMGLVGSAAFVVAGLCRRPEETTPAAFSALAIVVCAVVAGELLGVRGQVVSVLGVALTLLVVTRWRSGRERSAWWLVPIVAAWANVHAGFVAGLGIALLSALTVAIWQRVHHEGAPRSRPSVLLAATAVAGLAALANPAGPRLYAYVVATFANPRLTGSIVEWQSPDFHQTMLRAFEVLVVALVILWVRSRRPDPLDVVLALGLLVASLQAQRNVSLFCVVATPQLARYGALVWAEWRARRDARLRWPQPPRWFAPLVASTVVAAVVGVDVAPRLRPDGIATDVAHRYPVAAANAVAARFPGERLYSTYEWGGYLAFRFPVGRVVFVYGESAIFGSERLDEYLTVHLLAPGWQDVLDRWGMRHAIVPAASQEAAAFSEVGWTVLCHDPESDAVVMVAASRPVIGPIATPPPDPRDAPVCRG